MKASAEVVRRQVEADGLHAPEEVPSAPRTSPRPLVGVVLMGIAAVVGTWVLHRAGATGLAHAVLFLLQMGPAAFVLARARRQPAAQRPSSLLLGASLLANGVIVGILWGHADVARPIPSPWAADVLFVGSVLCTSAALLVHPVLRRERGRRWGLVLDGLIAAVALLAVEWVTFLGDLFGVLPAELRLDVVPITFPVGHAVNVTLGLLALIRARHGERATVGIITAGLLAWLVGDLGAVHGAATDHTFLAPFAPAAMAGVGALLLALGATQPLASGESQDTKRTQSGVLSIVLAGVPLAAVIVLALRDPDNAVVVACAITLTGLVLLRQVFTVLGWLATSVSLEEAVRRQEQRWEALIHNFTDCLTLVDAEGRILYDSPSVERLLGYRPGDRNLRPMAEFLHPDDRQSLQPPPPPPAPGIPAAGQISEQRMVRADGGWRWTEAVTTNLLHVPEVQAVVVNYRDIEDRRSFEGELRRMASNDVLTGLANRARLMDELDRLPVPGREGSSRTALMLIDLDGFKAVNDSLGHEAGDELLSLVASRMTRVLRPHDLAARLGGDEFAVVLPGTEPETARQVAERILDSLRHPFAVTGRQVVVQASIGVAATTRGEPSADSVLSHADIAMYAAKAAGKGRVCLFSGAMHDTAIDRLRLASDLGAALERGEIRPYFQPIVEVATGTIVGFEALARWDHPERGSIPAIDFITLAEETGLILELGHQMLVKALAQLREWQEYHPRETPLHMSVNVSGTQFQHPDIVDRILSALNAVGVTPGTLCLELTESTLIGSRDVIDKLERLRAAGIVLAIDDFGTGYSSLAYLRRLPVDIVKIDRSLIDGVASQPEQWAVARAIMNLLQTLGLDSVAEGVERADQMTHLRSLGCHHAQGYFYARPLPADQIEGLLEREARLPEL